MLLAEAIEENFKKENTGNTEDVVETPNAEVTNENNDSVVADDDISFVDNNVPAETIVSDDVVTNSVESNTAIDNTVNLEDNNSFDISKYTDGEFNKVEDLVNSYKALKENTVSSGNVMDLLNQQTQDKYGIDYSDLVSLKSINYDSMSDFDLLAEYEEFKDPEITQEEIDAELEQFSILTKSQEEIKNMIEDGDITEKEYKMINAQFSKRVRQAKGELKSFQDELSLDDIKLTNINNTVEKPREITQEEVMAQKESMRNDLKSFGKLRINLGDKDARQDFDFDVTESDKTNLIDTVSNPNWIVDRWTENDGSINRTKAYRDAYVLSNFNKMIKAAYNEGVVRGSKKHVVNEDNITLGQGKQVNNNSAVDPLQSLADKMGQYL